MTLFNSKVLQKSSKPFDGPSQHLIVLFPDLEWDLRKAGLSIDPVRFMSIVLYMTLITLIGCILVIVLPLVVLKGPEQLYPSLLFSLVITLFSFLYVYFRPKMEIAGRSRRIDTDLEYMLKDMKIQLTSGVPLFDTLVNVGSGRYHECSEIADFIVQEVNSGKSIYDVLEEVGLFSPSEYLRNVLWQIVNAERSGSDIKAALDTISMNIRVDKENKIKAYAQELNMWGIIYMMVAIVVPSMGVTLMVILSSFMGGAFINEQLFWIILIFLSIFQVIFITFVKSKRPTI